jgi:BASS family bile acid:Na+ symporter
MLDEQWLMGLARVTVFTVMLQNGLTIPLRDLVSLQRKPALLIRSMVAVIQLVPGVVLVLLMLVELPVEAATGLALLASSPGAPLITQRSRIAAGSIPLAADLQLKLVLAAVLVTPLTLTLFKALFPLLPELDSSPAAVAREIAVVSIFPVGIGLFAQRFLPGTAALLSKRLGVVSHFLLLILAILIAWPSASAAIQLGGMVALAIVIMAAAALGIGHVMGAGASLNQRSSIATACIARNLGLAVIIATADGILMKLLPTLMAYMLLGMLVAVPYAVWVRRRLQRSGH